jgi:hypothetical protein
MNILKVMENESGCTEPEWSLASLRRTKLNTALLSTTLVTWEPGGRQELILHACCVITAIIST